MRLQKPDCSRKSFRCVGPDEPAVEHYCFHPKLASHTFSINMSSETQLNENTPYIFIHLHPLSDSGFVDIRLEFKISNSKINHMFTGLSDTNNILTQVSKKLFFQEDNIVLIQTQKSLSLLRNTSTQCNPVNLSLTAQMENEGGNFCFEKDVQFKGYHDASHIVLKYKYLLDISVVQQPQHVFATQGNMVKIAFTCKKENNSYSFIPTAEISWIENYFRGYFCHHTACNQRCTWVDTPFCFLVDYCINATSVAAGKTAYNFLIFRHMVHSRNVLNFSCTALKSKHYLSSWEESNTFCQYQSAALPIFRNRDELNQLLSLVKFSTHVPPLEAIFIGLHTVLHTRRCQKGKDQKQRDSQQTGFLWVSNEPMVYQKWPDYFPWSSVEVKAQTTLRMFFLRRSNLHLRNHLHSAKLQSNKYMYSTNAHLRKCTAIILHNLVDPVWVSTDCQEKLMWHTVCAEKINTSIEASPDANSLVCTRKQIKSDGMCLEFLWMHTSKIRENKMAPKWKCASNASALQFVFVATSVAFPPLLLCGVSLMLSYMSVGSIFQFKFSETTKKPQEYLLVNMFEQRSFATSGNLFACDENIFISFAFVCDRKTDCPGKELADELDCPWTLDSVSCSKWLHQPVDGKCLLPLSLRSPSLFSPTKYISSGKCSENKLLSCREGCFHFSDICIYKLQGQHIIPCKRGEHIQNCKTFECNMKFKCPNFYCIPWNITCDGRWDCPDGSDEVQTMFCHQNRSCQGAFKCHQAVVCVHLGDTCDGKTDCPLGDDEVLCSLSSHKCPTGCKCLLFAAKCQNITISRKMLLEKLPYELLFLTNCVFSMNVGVLCINWNLIKFSAPFCKLQTVCGSLQQMHLLTELNVGFNKFTFLIDCCFEDNVKLKSIQLNDNFIRTVQTKSFSKLSSLIFLNLSNNDLSNFDFSFLKNPGNLMVLSLFNFSLSKMTEFVEEASNLCILEVDTFEICCFITNTVRCTDPPPWNFTCSGILPDLFTKIAFYLVSTFISLSNIASIMLQRILQKKGLVKLKSYPTLVITINISDHLASVPLHLLWIADCFLGHNYLLFSSAWQSGPVCHIVYFLDVFYVFFSPALLCLLSYSRFSVVKFPIESMFKETKFVRKVILAVCVVSVSFSVGFAILNFIMHDAIAHPLCSPNLGFGLSNVVTVVVIALSALVQTGALIFISCFTWRMVSELYSSQPISEGQKARTKVTLPLLAQMFVMISSNIVSWIPSGVVFIVVLQVQRFPPNMLALVTVFLTPLNSITNPVVFIATTARKLVWW